MKIAPNKIKTRKDQLKQNKHSKHRVITTVTNQQLT